MKDIAELYRKKGEVTTTLELLQNELREINIGINQYLQTKKEKPKEEPKA